MIMLKLMHHYYSTFSIKAIGLCVALFLHDYAYAHQADTLKRQVLDEVVIRTGRHIELLSPSPVQILKEDDLQRLNSLSVADALRYFSGVQLKDYGGVGGLKTVNVRSLGTQHTAVFYDGLQLGNAQNGQVDLGKFSLENLEEVALYSGQRNDLLQSAGSFASASALFLKSKRPVFSNDKRLNTDFNLKTGSFGLVNPSLLLQYKVNNQVSAHLNAAFSNAHGKYKFRLSNGAVDTSAIRSNADIQTIRIETGMHGSTKRGEWQVKFFAFDAERGLPGAIVDNRLDYNQRLWEKNIFLQSSFTHHVNKKYSILLNGKYALDDLRYLDPEITTTKGYLENKYQEKEAFFSVANRYRMTPFWDLALALDYKHNTMDANLDNFPYPNRNSVLTVLATHLKFNRLDIQLNALNTWVKDEVPSGIRPADVNKVTPAVMLSWQPIRYTDFRVRSFY
ncbi:Plug domain-containing protein, partial [Pseudoxanthomonas sp. SGD-10]